MQLNVNECWILEREREREKERERERERERENKTTRVTVICHSVQSYTRTLMRAARIICAAIDAIVCMIIQWRKQVTYQAVPRREARDVWCLPLPCLISGLSFDSSFPSLLVFFCLVLLLCFVHSHDFFQKSLKHLLLFDVCVCMFCFMFVYVWFCGPT